MAQLPALSLSSENSTISLDHYLSKIADGDLTLIKVASASDPRSTPGDVLILDQRPASECSDNEYLLIEYGDRHIIRQKKHVAAILRRSALYVVGDGQQISPVRVIGRLIGWAAAACVLLSLYLFIGDLP